MVVVVNNVNGRIGFTGLQCLIMVECGIVCVQGSVDDLVKCAAFALTVGLAAQRGQAAVRMPTTKCVEDLVRGIDHVACVRLGLELVSLLEGELVSFYLLWQALVPGTLSFSDLPDWHFRSDILRLAARRAVKASCLDKLILGGIAGLWPGLLDRAQGELTLGIAEPLES